MSIIVQIGLKNLYFQSATNGPHQHTTFPILAWSSPHRAKEVDVLSFPVDYLSRVTAFNKFQLFMYRYFFFCFRDVKNGCQELMVNFVTSSYQPELLKPLVEKISDIPEVVCVRSPLFSFYST